MKKTLTVLFIIVLTIYSAPLKVEDNFTPSGFMGDYNKITMLDSWDENAHSGDMCYKFTYTPGDSGWGGVYWQNEPNNWGDEQGNNYSEKNFTKVTFWARGETGKEIVEFKAGGIKNSKRQYQDSFKAKTDSRKIKLTKEWKLYTINLVGMNLSSVIGGFCWSASGTSNPAGLTFFIDDIMYE